MDIVKKVNKVEDFKTELGQVVEAISDDVLVYFNNPTIPLGEKSKTIAQFCK
jgi:F0F1-type ATP synthase delta subunit